MGGFGYGGNAYGFSPYGSAAHPRLPVPPGGGYGGAAYGLSSYGSVDITPPRVTGANPIDGYSVEVLFSEEMAHDSHLTDAANYVLTATYGVPLTVVQVSPGTPGSHDGYTSVIVYHTGSTLGGLYVVTVDPGPTGPRDLAGNIVGPPPTNSASFSAYGDKYTVNALIPAPPGDDGRTVLLEFFDSRGLPQALLPESSFSPGVDAVASYSVVGDYPVAPVIHSAEQVAALPSKVFLDVSPMTKVEYDLTVGPAEAFDYQGKELPSAATSFDGVEVGTGTSEIVSNQLVLSKAVGVTYGWSFGDTSGRLIDGTTYRADIVFQCGSAHIHPPVTGSSLFSFTVNDGSRQVILTLGDIAGTKVIDISTPLGVVGTVPAEWGANSAETLTLVRNQYGGFYSVLFNGVPLLTFPIGAVTPTTIPVGAQALLLAPHEVQLFVVKQVEISASSTVFSSTWNFIHELKDAFLGSVVLTRDVIQTARGPLVRGWGDATPATRDDVEVRLDGVGIEVRDVNPWVGEIYPTIPIPLAAPGDMSVELDYIWFSNPPMVMEGLNTRGLTLNKWDRSVGHTPGAHSPVPASSKGASLYHRFPMGTLLGPKPQKSPKHIGHRYMGFQLGGYSALLNQPTTLLTNQNPHELSVGGMKASSQEEVVTYHGRVPPADDSAAPWALTGTDAGYVGNEDDYILVDAVSGTYKDGTPALYERNVDLSLACAVEYSVRVQLKDTGTYDGVFSGVGIGVHDGLKMPFVGFLKVDGVRSLGLLENAARPDLESAWKVGPGLDGIATTATTIKLPYNTLLSGVKAGSAIRIPTGPQAGVYTVASCGTYLNEDGTITLVLNESLPARVDLFGNDTVYLLFDVPWGEELVSVRMLTDFPGGVTTVSIGGSVSGTLVSEVVATAFPASTSLVIPAIPKGPENGSVFWGSLSRRATNISAWEVVHYSVIPKYLVETSHGITVLTEMNRVPQTGPTPWFISGGFGYAEVDSTGDTLLLKSNSQATNALNHGNNLTFSYNRAVPFLTPKTRTEVEATFKVESHIQGSASASLIIEDTERVSRVSTISYLQGENVTESDGTPVYRKLLNLPACSLSGLLKPVDANWSPASWNNTDTNTVAVFGNRLVVSQGGVGGSLWSQGKTLPSSDPLLLDGVIADARIKIRSSEAADGRAGPTFGVVVPFSATTAINIQVDWLPDGKVGLIKLPEVPGDPSVIVDAWSVGWDDQRFHDYRLVCDPTANIAVLVVDDEVQGSAPLDSFLEVPSDKQNTFYGRFGVIEAATSLSVWDSFSVVPLRTLVTAAAGANGAIVRTLGLLVGADPDKLDGYRLPRLDSLSVANTDPSAQIVPMDWKQDYIRARMYYDPEWGVCVYRPDLSPPPWYTGDFATETTDPSAAWISVETPDIPTLEKEKGSIRWGSINPYSITSQRWRSVRYRLRGAPDGFGIAPQNMILNRYHRLTSGEWLYDTTPEVVTINSSSHTTVSVRASAMQADRVFVVQVDGVVIPIADWAFDKATQTITFVAPLPSSSYPVTITFVASQPVTETYLCSQPIEQSVTLLNEGTPPVPTGRHTESIREVLAGSRINDPLDVLDDAETLITNDPHRVVKFKETATSLYTDMSFCEVEDGESIWISSLCDGPGIAQGFAGIEVDGTDYGNSFTVPEGPAGPWGKSSPTFKKSSTYFDQSSVLLASGGVIQGGVLGPGTAVLYPNARGPSGKPPPGMGLNQEFRIVMQDVTPRTDSFDPGWMGDNVPPTNPIPVTDNPDGVPGTFGVGKCVARLVDYGSDTGTSRLGPWGAKTWFGEVIVLDNASILAGDTITIGGLPLTASAGAPGADEFQIGATDAETVANIRDAINDTANSFLGLCHAQVETLPTTNQVNISSSRSLTFTLSNEVAFRPNPRTGTLVKRSVLAGGSQLDGYQLVLSGGLPLPSPTVTVFTIEAASAP